MTAAGVAPLDPRIYANLDELVRLRHRARGFSYLPRQPVHSVLSGRHSSRLRGRGLNFDELRHYRPGDDIRTLDWKVTNRTGKPHVRAYTEERERTVVLMVDQRVGMFFGSRNRMKSVVAAEAAALSAWRVVGVGDRVGAVVFNDHQITPVRPHRSAATVMQICHVVLSMNHALSANGSDQGTVTLNDALRQTMRLVTHDSLLVLIGDLKGWNEDTLTLLKRHGLHNDAMVALVFDALESDLGADAALVVSDGLQQIEVTGADRSLRRRYAELFEHSTGELRASLRRCQIPMVPLNTSDDVVMQVRRAMGQTWRQG